MKILRKILSGDGFQTRGRCYDHDFHRFVPIFGEKNGVFSKTNVMIEFLQKLAVVREKNAHIFRKMF
jgi:hypothetical protein